MNIAKRMLLVLPCVLAANLAWGQMEHRGPWRPDRPIRLVVPFAAGGGNDLTSRIISTKAFEIFGQPVVVENRPGAGGAIGSDYVARSQPDGAILEMGSVDTHSIYPHLYERPKFPAKEFIPVAAIAKVDMVLVGSPNLEAKTLPELIALSQKRQLSFASWGPGSVSHLSMEAFLQATKLTPYLHVPYQGAGPAVQAVVSSQVDLAVVVLPLAKAQTTLTKFGVLASERSKLLPNVPTLREQKIDVLADSWIGILAPPKTPDAIIGVLSKGFTNVAQSPAITKSMEEAGFSPFVLGSSDFKQHLERESSKWGAIVRHANVRLD